MTDPTGSAPTPPQASVTPDAAPPRKRRTGLFVGIAVGVVALVGLAAGGVFALNSFMRGGVDVTASESAAVFPADTFVWAEFAVDPSPAQKLEALRMLENLPEARDWVEDELDVDLDDDETDLMRAVWEWLDDEGMLDEIDTDYDDIVEWLGDRIAFGMLPGGNLDAVNLIVAVEVTDEELAIEYLEDLVYDLRMDDAELTARDGYVLVTPDWVDLDEAFEAGTLAESAVFSEAAERLGEWGLMSSWSSTKGLAAEITGLVERALDEEGMLDADSWHDTYRTAAEEYELALAAYQDECVGKPNLFYSGDFESDLFTGFCFDVINMQVFVDHYGFEPDDWEDAAQERADHIADLLAAQKDAVEQMPDASTVAVMRFADGGIEFTGETIGLGLPQLGEADEVGALASLPESTMAAFSLSPLGEIIDSALSVEYLEAFPQAAQLSLLTLFAPQVGPVGSLPQLEATDLEEVVEEGRQQIADALAEFDLEFPDDLRTLFGSSVAVVIDEDPGCMDSMEECTDLGAGAVITTNDPDTVVDMIDALVSRIVEQLAGPFGYPGYPGSPGFPAGPGVPAPMVDTETAPDTDIDSDAEVDTDVDSEGDPESDADSGPELDAEVGEDDRVEEIPAQDVVDLKSGDGRVAVGRGDYVDELLDEDDRLGDVDLFVRTMPALDGALAAFFLNLDSLIALLDSDGDLDALEGLGAVGWTVTQTADGDLVTRARITTLE